MKRFYLLAFVFVFLLAGCTSTPTPEEQLAKMGYEVSNEQFLRCAKQGNLEAVKLFVEAGINIDTRDMSEDGLGVTALINACDKEHIDVARHLLENGADVNAKTDLGDHALIVAVCRENIELINMCLEYGAEVDVKGYAQNTALHYAIMNDNLEIVKTLVEAGADLETRNRLYYTPLLSASQKNQENIVEYLLSKGADASAKSVFGNTAYELAESNEIKEMLKKPR